MDYQHSFKAARDQYHQKIEKIASKVLISIVVDDKLRQLAQKLDENKSNPFQKMDLAMSGFDAARLSFTKKLNDQTAKEPQAAQLKPLNKVLIAALDKIAQDYEKDCENKRKTEALAAKAAAEEKKDQDDSLKDDISRVTDEYKKRGDNYLSLASKLEKELEQITKNMKVEIEEAEKKIAKLNSKPTPEEKQKSVQRMEVAYKKLKESWEKAQKSHKELSELKKEDGDLKLEAVAKDLRIQLPNTAKPELDKAYRLNSKSFVRANQIVADIEKKFPPEAQLVDKEMKKISAGIKEAKKSTTAT
ncbi:MAG TPA: hypothetical protein VMB03_18605 [Bryobacteraceae bacterium]|nr:hypothetical protein [Bryobacteraceae bacterium]